MGFDVLVMDFLRKGNTAATWSGELGQFAPRVRLLGWREGDQAQGRRERKKEKTAQLVRWLKSVKCPCVSRRSFTRVEAFIFIPSTEQGKRTVPGLLPTCLAELVNFRFSESPCLKVGRRTKQKTLLSTSDPYM